MQGNSNRYWAKAAWVAIATLAAAIVALGGYVVGQGDTSEPIAARSTTTTAAPTTTSTTTTTVPPTTTSPPATTPPTTAPPVTISPAAMAAARESAIQAVTSAERAVRSYELAEQKIANLVATDERELAEAEFRYGKQSGEANTWRQRLDEDRKLLENTRLDLGTARDLLKRATAHAKSIGAM